VYRVDPRGVDALRSYLDQLWDKALAAFAEAVERTQDNDDKGAQS
jgi:hypothetical protein